MASGPHPPLLGSYLTELDIHETVTAGDGTLWNLLLGDLQCDSMGITATVLKGGFLQAQDFGHTTRPVPPIVATTQKVYVQFPGLSDLQATPELLITRLFLHRSLSREGRQE